MDDPATFIEGSEKLTNIFGYWPSFHDAEVIEFNLWRGDVDPDAGRWVFPTLITKVHLWELTTEVDARGHYVRHHSTFVTLRFRNLNEFLMEGFNHQNAIFGLRITNETREGGAPSLRVKFDPAFGLASAFLCEQIDILQAESEAPAHSLG